MPSGIENRPVTSPATTSPGFGRPIPARSDPRRAVTAPSPVTAASEVAPSGERVDDEGPAGLVDGEADAAGRGERRARAGRQLDRPVSGPAACPEAGRRGTQVLDPIYEHGAIVGQMVGQEHRGAIV